MLHGMKDASPEALLLFECFCFRANYAACLAAPRGDRLDGAPKEDAVKGIQATWLLLGGDGTATA